MERQSPESLGILHREALEYIETVLARAEGRELREELAPGKGPVAVRIVPGFLKRAFVRALIYLFRHPFDHLSHPMEVEAEHHEAELRALVHAAQRRADQSYRAMQQTRPELDSWRRALHGAIEDLEQRVEALEAKLREAEQRR